MTAIASLILSVLNSSSFLDLFKGKEQKKAEFIIKLEGLINEHLSKQIEVNKIEAQHGSKWVAGWRPFVGWCCGSALAYNFILQPFLLVLLGAFNVDIVPPTLDIGQLITILLGMLGLSSMRTFEKVKLK